MNETKAWTIIIIVLATVVIVLITSTAIYHINRNQAIVASIAGGADPLQVACALDNLYIETCRDVIQAAATK